MDYAFTRWLVTYCFHAIGSDQAAFDSSRTTVLTPPQRRASKPFDILLGNSLVHDDQVMDMQKKGVTLPTLDTARRFECG
jgi:hypothetical protein